MCVLHRIGQLKHRRWNRIAYACFQCMTLESWVRKLLQLGSTHHGSSSKWLSGLEVHSKSCPYLKTQPPPPSPPPPPTNNNPINQKHKNKKQANQQPTKFDNHSVNDKTAFCTYTPLGPGLRSLGRSPNLRVSGSKLVVDRVEKSCQKPVSANVRAFTLATAGL
jgi:hypothetical protein